MNVRHPRISVVIAVRNGAATLERALESVFAQTYPNVELVVIDGASTDGTQAILARHADRIAYWHSEPDRGIYDAWNKALDHVTGDWICFLGADDRFAAPEVLARVAGELADTSPLHRVAYAQIHVVDPVGGVVATHGAPWREVAGRFRAGMAIPHQATFHHRELFAVHGRFDTSFKIAGDYELLLREIIKREPRFLPGLVVVDMGAGGLSDRPAMRIQRVREFERARRLHGLRSAPEWRAGAVLRARGREAIRRVLGPRAEARAVDAYRFVACRLSRARRRAP